MSLIEHWTARSPAGLWQIVDDGSEANLAGFRRAGWTVEGPFVPADQLRGAVETLRELLTLIDDTDYVWESDREKTDKRAIIERARHIAGGQLLGRPVARHRRNEG